MNSFWKSVLHTAITVLAFYLPTLIDRSGVANLTVGSLVSLVLNWLLSHQVATTSGASAEQHRLN